MLPAGIPPSGVGTPSLRRIAPSGIGVGGVGRPLVGDLVASLTLSFFITHTFRGDLVISLIAPDGTPLTVIDSEGGGGDDFGTTAQDLVLDDSASLAALSDIPDSGPAIGPYRPESPLSTFTDQKLRGWSLFVWDRAAADVGTVQRVTLTVTSLYGQLLTFTAVGPFAIPDNDPGGVTIPLAESLPRPPRLMSVTLVDTSELSADVRPSASARVAVDFIEAWQGAPYDPADLESPPPGGTDAAPPQHIGVNRPHMWARVRRGRFFRDYRYWNDEKMPVGATVAGSNNRRPWQATWLPLEPYSDLPNVSTFDTDKNYDTNGIGQATIRVENIMYPANAGGGHDRRRGYLSPLRGYLSPPLASAGLLGPTDLDGTLVAGNEWGGRLEEKLQITVYQTYGSAKEVKVFTGLVDDVDSTSSPDVMTITARDIGQVLSDEHLFGYNKDPTIKDPVVFIDRDEAEKTTKEGYDATASSQQDGHEADKVLDFDGETSWISHSGASSARTEWVQSKLPQGRYSDYRLAPAFAGMTVYASIFAQPLRDGSPATRDGVAIPAGWVDTGLGVVPGTNGGVPYVTLASDVSGDWSTPDLDAEYKMGDDSIIRLSFRDLAADGQGGFSAGVIFLHARARVLSPEAIKMNWVLVDDVADVVKVLLRWAGFKEWEVESTGIQLPKRMVFDRGMTFMDAIKQVSDGIGYVFFIKDPTPWSGSLGVPVFRKTWTLLRSAPGEHRVGDGSPRISASLVVTDRMLLTAIEIKQDSKPLDYIIRARGRESKNGKTLGGIGGKRVMYTFRPPWSSHREFHYLDGKMAGVIKHLVYVNQLFKTVDDCRFGAYFLALQQALASITATIEIPAYPGVDLDERVLVQDLGTGITTRLAIADRATSFVGGEQAKWTMTLTGSLIDTPNIDDMVEIINNAVGRS